jgi:hypothetical protein
MQALSRGRLNKISHHYQWLIYNIPHCGELVHQLQHQVDYLNLLKSEVYQTPKFHPHPHKSCPLALQQCQQNQ